MLQSCLSINIILFLLHNMLIINHLQILMISEGLFKTELSVNFGEFLTNNHKYLINRVIREMNISFF